MTRSGILLLTLIALVASGCATDRVEHIGPSRAAMERYGVDPGDTVLLRYANQSDPNSSSRSVAVRVLAIGEDGIVGANASGELVVAKYDELFQVEKKSSGFSGVPGAEVGGNMLKGVTNSVLFAACMAIAIGGGVAADCPQVGD